MGEAAALLSALTWSGTSVAMATIALRTSPVVLSALRLTIGSIILFAVLAAGGQLGEITAASTSSVWAMVGSGVVAYALGDTLYIYALNMLGVQRSFTVTMTLFISLTVLGGVVLLDEPFGMLQAAGTVLVAAGIATIVRTRSVAGDAVPASSMEPAAREHSVPIPAPLRDKGMLRGYLLIVVVAVLWATATLWLAAGRQELGSLAATSLRTPAGAIGLLTFALATRPRALVAPFRDFHHIGAIAAVGIAGTAFGSLAYVYAIGEAGAARATILSSVSPLMALPLSVVFLKEQLSRSTLLGTVVCVSGIVLVVSGS